MPKHAQLPRLFFLRGHPTEKLKIFKELTPRSRTYEPRGQGKEKQSIYKIKDKQTPHTVLQKLSPKACSGPLIDFNPYIPDGSFMVQKMDITFPIPVF